MRDPDRRVRADAERSVRSIMEAAERILGSDPTATMEEIAVAAGVSRATIHRHFANREALVADMARTAWRRIQDAVERAHPTTAPPLVALHQATANILRIKSGWPFALDQYRVDEATTQILTDVFATCDTVLARAQREGIISQKADLEWVRRVYIALIGETAHGPMIGESGSAAAGDHADPDALAARIIDTLLYGAASRPQ